MWLHSVLFLSFFVGIQCTEGGINCLAKEKSLEVLNLANDTLGKLKHLLPNCTNSHPSSNTSECGVKEKALALIEIATDLISEAKRNHPNCLDDSVTDPVTETVTVTDTMTVSDNATETEPATVSDTATETEPVTVTNPPMDNPIDCGDVLKQGKKSSGVYEIWPNNTSLYGRSILVYCDLESSDRQGWTVIQRRGVNYARQYFNQDWNTYKKGFGDLNGEFWLGNENIYYLTNQGNYALRIDLEDTNGIEKYARYNSFRIKNEGNYYQLHIQNYSGTAGDSMLEEIDTYFTTKDRTHDKKVNGVLCVESRATGWWYWGGNNCNGANLNGLPGTGVPDDPKNLYWKKWKNYESLAKATMKIRRR